jgi:DNA (cytosine-5)-methyltransferase 1
VNKPRLLDFFCGAGGASVGYHRAGFEVVGVDIKPQKNYPFEIIQMDAFEALRRYHRDFDAFHASPPCQFASIAAQVHRNAGKVYADHLTPMRKELPKYGKPYIIENVPGAPMNVTLILCGLMFDLRVFRHRWFECSHLIMSPFHPSHAGKRVGEGYYSVAGGAGRWKSWGRVMRNVSKGTAQEWREAMGIDWMTRDELTQAIPPAYTEWIGRQIIDSI